MSWFLKRSSLRSGEDIRWHLQLRLARWRHFLVAEGVCFDLLKDLRDKLSGEYIFDRQYVQTALGQIFQSAYQVAHDRAILEKADDASMFLWLDHIKEGTDSYVRNFSKPAAATEPTPTLALVGFESSRDSPNLESGAWTEEPEYLIIKGVLDLLDPSDRSQLDASSDRSSKLDTFRQGLKFAHEQVLLHLIEPESWQVWADEGVAKRFKDARPFPLFAIDVREGTEQSTSNRSTGDTSASEILHSTPWLQLSEGMSSSRRSNDPAQDHRTSPLFLVVSESALFLTGAVAAGKICLDVVLTGIREFNHWFLRWEHDSIDTQRHHRLAGLFGSDCQRGTGLCEVLNFNQTAEEVEASLRKFGEALVS